MAGEATATLKAMNRAKTVLSNGVGRLRLIHAANQNRPVAAVVPMSKRLIGPSGLCLRPKMVPTLASAASTKATALVSMRVRVVRRVCSSRNSFSNALTQKRRNIRCLDKSGPSVCPTIPPK